MLYEPDFRMLLVRPTAFSIRRRVPSISGLVPLSPTL